MKGEEDAVENDDAEEVDRSRDLGQHVVQACTIDMHVNIWQRKFCTEIYRKMPRPRTTDMHVNAAERPVYLQENRGPGRWSPEPRTILSASMHNENATLNKN